MTIRKLLGSHWLSIGCIAALAVLILLVQLGNSALKNGQGESALAFPLASSRAATDIASSLQAAGDMASAKDYADIVLAGALHNVPALRIAGMHLAQSGQDDSGKRLVEIAGELSWRDSPTSAWLFESALREGNYALAIDHADALLRRRKASSEIFRVFTLAAQEPSLITALIKKFEAKPDWRANFFLASDQYSEVDRTGLETLTRNLQPTTAPVSKDELTHYVAALIDSGQTRRGLTFWSEIFPENGTILTPGRALELAWPTAARLSRPYPSDWRFLPSRQFFPLIRDKVGKDGAGLELELQRQMSGDIASHPVNISPGRVRLIVDESAAQDPLINKLDWRLRCRGSDANSSLQFNQIADDRAIWDVETGAPCATYDLIMRLPSGNVRTTQRVTIPAITLQYLPR